jgi:hypothetical protein
LHTHSTNSDGALPPEEVVRRYQDAGYDFIALTDHFLPKAHFGKDHAGFIPVTDTTGYRTGTFTTLLGAEIHGPSLRSGELWHIVAIGLPLDFPEWTQDEFGPAIAARAASAGAFIGIAHPAWYGLTVEDTRQVLSVAHAVEIFNQSCVSVDCAESWHFADMLLAEGERLTAFAADDAHFRDPHRPDGDAFGGWVHVKAESLDPDELLEALKRGDYYSSTGAELRDIRQDGDDLIVECAPAVSVIVSGKGANRATLTGNCIEAGRFDLGRFQHDGYCRVMVIDESGKKAWSNPIWLDA